MEEKNMPGFISPAFFNAFLERKTAKQEKTNYFVNEI
jgi:hypothetical protein